MNLGQGVSFLIGAILNKRYRIKSLIGEGGMASVYSARDLVLERIVAAKILHEHFSKNQDLKKRFHAEASTSARLEHKNIVKTYDYGVDDSGRAFIITEYVRGRNLHEIEVEQLEVYQKAAHPLLVALVCRELSYALAVAHEENIVHRDVKPDNVMITDNGQVKLMDFGIAKNIDASLTTIGHFLGSPSYSSPEQIQGETIDNRSDIFSFGIILYEGLVGELPFNGKSASDIMVKILNGSYKNPLEHNSRLPLSLCEIIAKCLLGSREKRFTNMREVSVLLDSYISEFKVDDSEKAIAEYLTSSFDFIVKYSPLDGVPPVQQIPLNSNLRSTGSENALPQVPSIPVVVKAQMGSPAAPEIPVRGQQLRAKTLPTNRPDAPKANAGSSKQTHLVRQGNLPAKNPARKPVRHHVPQPRTQRSSRSKRKNESRAMMVTLILAALSVAGVVFALLFFKQSEISSESKVVAPVEIKPTESSFAEVKQTEIPVSREIKEPREVKEAKEVKQIVSAPIPRKEVRPVKKAPAVVKPVEDFGSVSFVTIPGRVPVEINGERQGLSADGDYTTLKLKAGKHVLKIRARDVAGTRYEEYESTFRVNPQGTSQLGVIKLKALHPLDIKCLKPCSTVRVNGKQHKPGDVYSSGDLKIEVKFSDGRELSLSRSLGDEGLQIRVPTE